MFPKPAKGSHRQSLLDKRAAIRSHEDREKRAVRLRDGGVCRWPFCGERGQRWRLEVAHLHAKGMGGDKGTRSTRDQMILLCFNCHQGPNGLERHGKRITPLTDAGTYGPCKFEELREEGWVVVMQERFR